MRENVDAVEAAREPLCHHQAWTLRRGEEGKDRGETGGEGRMEAQVRTVLGLRWLCKKFLQASGSPEQRGPGKVSKPHTRLGCHQVQEAGVARLACCTLASLHTHHPGTPIPRWQTQGFSMVAQCLRAEPIQ